MPDSAPARKNSGKPPTERAQSEESANARGQDIETSGPNRQLPPERKEAERTIVIPSHTPLPGILPVHTPESAPAMPPAAPPIAAGPLPERGPPVQSQAPQAPSHFQQQPVLHNLSDDEKAKLHSAHQAALHDSSLAASRDRYLNARKEFRTKLRDALLKADPSVQPILEKIHRDKSEER